MFDQAQPAKTNEAEHLSPRYGFENASLIIDQLRRNGTGATADAIYAFVRQEMGYAPVR